ncbi:hypothetical protein [Candidatus Corynebacterium faecigallinarum]|uniref:hypothetical protein n=1 Tax=Candidatus Corynebacterium faecigallinarum TaxID=2838528 RepID=UPI003FD0138A
MILEDFELTANTNETYVRERFLKLEDHRVLKTTEPVDADSDTSSKITDGRVTCQGQLIDVVPGRVPRVPYQAGYHIAPLHPLARIIGVYERVVPRDWNRTDYAAEHGDSAAALLGGPGGSDTQWTFSIDDELTIIRWRDWTMDKFEDPVWLLVDSRRPNHIEIRAAYTNRSGDVAGWRSQVLPKIPQPEEVTAAQLRSYRLDEAGALDVDALDFTLSTLTAHDRQYLTANNIADANAPANQRYVLISVTMQREVQLSRRGQIVISDPMHSTEPTVTEPLWDEMYGTNEANFRRELVTDVVALEELMTVLQEVDTSGETDWSLAALRDALGRNHGTRPWRTPLAG